MDDDEDDDDYDEVSDTFADVLLSHECQVFYAVHS